MRYELNSYMQSQFIIEKILCSWVLSIYKVLYIFAMRYVFCLIHRLLKLLLTIVIGCSELTVPYVYKRQLLLVSSQTQLFFVQVLLNRHLLLLTWSFIKQSVLKQLLTEGEKHEVASYHSCHLAAICYENFFHVYKIDLFFSTKVFIFISLSVHCALFGSG